MPEETSAGDCAVVAECPSCGGRMGIDLGGNPFHVGVACDSRSPLLAEIEHHDLLLAIAENSGDEAAVLDELRVIHRLAMEVVSGG